MSPQELLDLLGLGNNIVRLTINTMEEGMDIEHDAVEQDKETETVEEDGAEWSPSSSPSHCGGITSSESEGEEDEETCAREGEGDC